MIFILAGAALLWFPSFLAWHAGARDPADHLRWLMGKTPAFIVWCREIERTGFHVLLCGGFWVAFEALWR